MVAKEFFKNDEVILAPLDIPKFYKNIVEKYSIKKLIIAETEIWPFMIMQMYRLGVEVSFVNALITDSSYGAYKKISKIYPYFNTISKVITKSELYVDRWKTLGVKNVIAGVDIKAPQELESFDKAEYRQKLKLKEDAFIPILVSTREGEEDLFLDILEFCDHIIIVPRHFDKTGDKIIKFCDDNEISWVRSSYVNLEVDSYGDFKVIIIDQFGVMDLFYKVASIAFVGGTIADIGGHNILEPLKYKLPTCCGNSTYNQIFAVELSQKFGVVDIIKKRDEFAKTVSRLKQKELSEFNSALDSMISYITQEKCKVYTGI